MKTKEKLHCFQNANCISEKNHIDGGKDKNTSFGVSNVGKSTTGKLLANRLGFSFMIWMRKSKLEWG